VELPLFPGYVFCRFQVLRRLPILMTPGIVHVVGIGGVPAPIDEIEITSLQKAMQEKLAAQPTDFLQVGQRVRIVEGALSGVEGIVLDFKNSIQLVLSITLLQRSVRVEVDRDWVAAHAPAVGASPHVTNGAVSDRAFS
jgi:transcription antitermination factor NusG